MEIIISEDDYNWKKYRATLHEHTNKWYANYDITITWGGDTEEEAKEHLIEKAKSMIEEINSVIYK